MKTHSDAALYTKNALDSGQIRDAAYGVMAMFDLAQTDEQIADAYEQAGIVYMGLGRWEEAQANFEAADTLIPGNIHSDTLPEDVLNRKLTLMTNIGSLMAKRGNPSWAMMFGQNVVSHPKAYLVNQGWGHLVMGEAALTLESYTDASTHFQDALCCFQTLLKEAEQMPVGNDNDALAQARSRAISQAQGNVRWAQIHQLFSEAQAGSPQNAETLADLEAEWTALDPEASAMAGLFHALCIESEKRRALKLQDIQARARRRGLGEIAQRARMLLGLAVFLVAMATSASFQTTSSAAQSTETTQSPDIPADHPESLARGNTGKGGKGTG